jgi:hypothetical protein
VVAVDVAGLGGEHDLAFVVAPRLNQMHELTQPCGSLRQALSL